MTARAAPRPVSPIPWREMLHARPALFTAFALTALALLLRSAWFGDPLAGYDEQFYLLVGDRMLHGALPYVDIWDRKPIGLFLIYAAARLLGGDGVLGYQVLAALSVAGTGCVIAAIVRRRFAPGTALLCGLLYIAWTGVMGGENGQSPLFYNLLVASAALLTLDAVASAETRAGYLRGCGAMALCGLALTVKTTVVFEACFLGLTLTWSLWQARVPLARLVPGVAFWMALGALPFLAVMLFYAAAGHFADFWFANATSAARRSEGWDPRNIWALCLTLAPLGPLLLLAIAGAREPGLPRWERRFLFGWIAAACVGFAAVGYFYHHYALPLLVPLTVAAAPFLAHSRHRKLALILFLAFPSAKALVLDWLLVAPDRADARAAVEAIPDSVRQGCMLIYGGPPILYHLTNACLVSPFAFPGHLYLTAETPAIPVDQAGATAAALAKRPEIVVTEDNPSEHRRNLRSDAIVNAALAEHYRPIAARGYRYFEESRHKLLIWQRRD